MTPRETVIEAMAEAHHNTEPAPYTSGDWAAMVALPETSIGYRYVQSVRRKQAAALDAFLATLPALGIGVTTIKLSDAALDAGWTAVVHSGERKDHPSWGEYIQTCHAAMLTAATNPLETRDE